MDKALEPASFLRRLTALIIDILILSVANAIILEPVVTLLGFRQLKDPALVKLPFAVAVMLSYAGTAILFLILAWLYFALQESSEKGATFGKRIANIVVQTTTGDKLSFAQGTSRFFSKFVSAILFLAGFILVLFRPDKRALHDLMADTKVAQLATQPKEAVKLQILRPDAAVSVN